MKTAPRYRMCRLLDGDGEPTEEHPPTLREVYETLDSNALINVELKVFEPPCLTETTGPEELVPLALATVSELNGENRTIFSSFDETAADLVKTERPDYYSALISLESRPQDVETAVLLNQDAIHPSILVAAETVQSALDEDLQVNVWAPSTAPSIQIQLDKGATGIITDAPALLADLPAS